MSQEMCDNLDLIFELRQGKRYRVAEQEAMRHGDGSSWRIPVSCHFHTRTLFLRAIIMLEVLTIYLEVREGLQSLMFSIYGLRA
jgi:hypothetical protein